jgi:hypothetical protein
MVDNRLRVDAPGFLSGLIFFAVVLIGCAYIVFSKLQTLAAVYVTLVPVCIMVLYALLLGLTRLFRLRDDQSGDNLYYMGFLFTLTSLAVSLYQFSVTNSVEQIVRNFGIAIASTIAGIALRIFFNQMRRDPIEVEHTARLELAEASRKVKRELEGTVLEFSYFRRATQQSLADALDEVIESLRSGREKLVAQLEEFAQTFSRPLEHASNRSTETIDQFSVRFSQSLETISRQLSEGTIQLSNASTTMIRSVGAVASKLEAMQTPDHVIEIKLNPLIQGLSRAVNTFSKNAESHTEAVNTSNQKTQMLSSITSELISELRTARVGATAGAQVDGHTPPPPGNGNGSGHSSHSDAYKT